MRRGLIGDDVGHDAARDQLLEHLGGVADETDRATVALRPRLLDLAQRAVEVGRHEVEVARLDAAVEMVRVDVDDQADAVVHRDRERLGAAHATAAGGQHEPAAQRAAEAGVRDRRERLVRPLHDALGADVDPRAGRHLAVHRQPLGLEPPERVPVRPLGHEVRVRDQHARRQRRACGRRRRACPTARASSRRRRGAAASRRSRRRPPTSARRARCRRTRRGCRDPRPRRGRGCSSACGARPPATSLDRRARGRAGRERDGGRRSSVEDGITAVAVG